MGEEGNVPPDCMRKEMTSPVTKTVVNHLALMIEWLSPSVNFMIRARIM